MVDRFQGDPKMVLTVDGSNLVFKGGQPVMDQGQENPVMMSLFTRDWIGNVLYKKPAQKLGSRYEELNARAITYTNINEARMAAEAALQWMVDAGIVREVAVRIVNIQHNKKNVYILVTPPPRVLELSSDGVRWQLQAIDPAYLKVI